MIDLKTLMVESAPSYIEGAKYLKTKYSSNKDRFEGRFLEKNKLWGTMNNTENISEIIKFYSDLWDTVEPYTYAEAFAIGNQDFRALVFSVINVPEMIQNLGTKRVKTEGIELIDRSFDSVANKFVETTHNQIYELHKVNGDLLGLEDENIFAIKCWCTSTNDEHWLWVDEETGLKGEPLEAIASTCKFYSSMLGHIKHIIRQGDVFLFEMETDITPNESDKLVSLPSKEYFSLLKSQS